MMSSFALDLFEAKLKWRSDELTVSNLSRAFWMGSVVLTAPVVIWAVMLVMVATPATEVLNREIGCLREGEWEWEEEVREGKGREGGKRKTEGGGGNQELAYPPFVTRTWSTPFSLNSWITSEHSMVGGTVMAVDIFRLLMGWSHHLQYVREGQLTRLLTSQMVSFIFGDGNFNCWIAKIELFIFPIRKYSCNKPLLAFNTHL